MHRNVGCDVLDWVNCIETQVIGSCEEGKEYLIFIKCGNVFGSKATTGFSLWTLPHVHPLQSAEHKQQQQ